MSRSRAGGAAAANWLARLLNLVPYLLARPGIRIADAAADLGVSEQQLRDDLRLLWVCGLPGYGPGDLIDMAFDGDRVTITYSAGIDRPLRLTPDEALSLVVALRLLAETPGVTDRAPVERALAKLEAAVGERPPVAVRIPGDADQLQRLREAVGQRRALELTYYSARADRITTRVVDPLRVVVVGGHGYLEAWCRTAGQVRRFRADRIDALHVLAEPAAPATAGPSPPDRAGHFPARCRAAAGDAAGGSIGALDRRVLPVRAGGRLRPGLGGVVAGHRSGLGAAAGVASGAGGDRAGAGGVGRGGAGGGGRGAGGVRHPGWAGRRRGGGGLGWEAMTVWWWIVLALVLLPLLVVVAVAVPVRSRMLRLQRLARRTAATQLAAAAALQPRQQQLQEQLAELERRSRLVRRRVALLRERVAQLRPSR